MSLWFLFVLVILTNRHNSLDETAYTNYNSKTVFYGPVSFCFNDLFQSETQGLLFTLNRTDVLVWPLILAHHAIYHHLHNWEASHKIKDETKGSAAVKLDFCS